MPKSKSLGERFIQQEGGGGGTKKVSKVYSSGTDPYQEGGSRGKKANQLDVRQYLDLVLPTIRDRRKRGSPMVGTLAEHLAKIRPDPQDNRRIMHPKNTNLGEMLIHTKNWRNSRKTCYWLVFTRTKCGRTQTWEKSSYDKSLHNCSIK